MPFLLDGSKPSTLKPAFLAERRIASVPPYAKRRWRKVAGRSIPPIGFPVLGNGIGIPEYIKGRTYVSIIEAADTTP
ncbi:MAG: hypothetical protein QW176_08325, partial [Candidatus Bathyarchaeia archaeon]